MNYRIRPGIIRRDAAGETMLVAVGDAIDFCPDMQLLNDGGAYYWALIEQGMDTEQMLVKASEDTGEMIGDLKPGLDAFLTMLKEKGYLMQVE